MSVSANDYYSQCPMRDRGTYRLNSLFSVAVTQLQGATNDEVTLLLPCSNNERLGSYLDRLVVSQLQRLQPRFQHSNPRFLVF